MASKNRIQAKDYQKCLHHIEKCWDEMTFYYPKDKGIHLGMPKRFISPNDGIYRYDQFYWDSYFIILGLVQCGRARLAKGMIENFLFMQQRFNIIPMRNRYYNLGSSQMPFLTSMIEEVAPFVKDKEWIRKTMKAAEKELVTYWMSKSITELHNVYRGLSRYCDHFITHLAAEHESGWDMTSRFHNHCLNVLPVDLNSALYKYERDLARFYKEARNPKAHEYYLSQSLKRKKNMNALMWNESLGFYFDYDFKNHKQNHFYSVAGFYPMWAKLATEEQAKRMVKCLRVLEHEFGIANTQSDHLSHEYKQHDYPNGWPHQHWIIVKSLLNYGFEEDALRIAKKYLDLNNRIFKKTGKMWEKTNVVEGNASFSERYPTQSGFGWTNAVFLKLINTFSNE